MNFPFLRFSVVFAFCLCVFALFLFQFWFIFPPFSLFRFSSFFFVFLFFTRLKRFLVFSAHFQAVAVDCPSVFGYGETAKTRREWNFAPTPSTPTPSETFQAMLLFQDSDPMTQALGWPMIRERIPLRQATGPLQIKIPQKYCDVMWAPNIAKLIISEFFDGCNVKNLMVFNCSVNLEKSEKNQLEKNPKFPVETGPRNCRFLSLLTSESSTILARKKLHCAGIYVAAKMWRRLRGSHTRPYQRHVPMGQTQRPSNLPSATKPGNMCSLIDLLIGLFRGAVFLHGGVPENSPLASMGRFTSLTGRFTSLN